MYLIVRDACQVCSEAGARGVIWGNESRGIGVGHDLTEGIVDLVGGRGNGRGKVGGAICRGCDGIICGVWGRRRNGHLS